MAKWLVEQNLGHNPPFLRRSIIRRSKSSIKLSYQAQIPENDCCQFVVTSIDSEDPIDFIKAFVRTRGSVIAYTIEQNKPITLFSCYDTLCLFFFARNGKRFRLFSHSLSCCTGWNLTSFAAKEVGLFGKEVFMERGTETINVRCKVSNLRSDMEYHSLISSVEPLDRLSLTSRGTFTVLFKGRLCNVSKYHCVLCLQPFCKLDTLISHINLQHAYYRCEYEKKVLSVIRRGKEDEKPVYLPSNIRSEYDVVTTGQIWTNESIRYMRAGGRAPRNGLDAAIKKQTLLINREYRCLDYSRILGDYASQELVHHSNTKELEVMKEWNKQRMKDEDPRKNLVVLLSKFGLSKETVELIEILYRGSSIDSLEILSAIEEALKR